MSQRQEHLYLDETQSVAANQLSLSECATIIEYFQKACRQLPPTKSYINVQMEAIRKHGRSRTGSLKVSNSERESRKLDMLDKQ